MGGWNNSSPLLILRFCHPVMRPLRICHFYACSLLWRATQSDRIVRPSSPAPSLLVRGSPRIDAITGLFWCLQPHWREFQVIRANTRTHERAKLRALRLNSIRNPIPLQPPPAVILQHGAVEPPEIRDASLSWAFVSNRHADKGQLYIVHCACSHIDTPLTPSPVGAASPPHARCWGIMFAVVEHEHVEKKETCASHLHVGPRVPDLLKTAWTLSRCHGNRAVVLSRRCVEERSWIKWSVVWV